MKKDRLFKLYVYLQLDDIERSFKMKGSEMDRKEFQALRGRIESLELVSKKVRDEFERFDVISMD